MASPSLSREAKVEVVGVSVLYIYIYLSNTLIYAYIDPRILIICRYDWTFV